MSDQPVKNPYDFVPLEGGIKRYPSTSQSGDGRSSLLLTGMLVCSLKTETPLFIGSGKGLRAPSLRYIPASSVKGAVRAVAEAVSDSCLSVVSQVYRDSHRGDLAVDIPEEYLPCANPGNPCFCCRLFGMAEGQEEERGASGAGERKGGLGGRVHFSAAVFSGEEEEEDKERRGGKEKGPSLMTIAFPARRTRVGRVAPALGKPVPWHEPFYFKITEHTEHGRVPLGRKFYYHHKDYHQTISIFSQRVKDTFVKNYLEMPVKAIKEENEFSFKVSFFDLDWDEFNVLLYSLQLESDMRHHMGMLKPFGLGSVKLKVTGIEMWSGGRFLAYESGLGQGSEERVAWNQLEERPSNPSERAFQVDVESIQRDKVGDRAWSVGGGRPRAGEAREKLKEILRWPGEGIYLYPDYRDFFRKQDAGRITLEEYQGGKRP